MNNSEKQVSLITESMVEAVEHMKDLLKTSNLSDFYPLLTNFIETLHVIIPYSQKINDEVALKLLSKIEQDITLGFTEIEKKNIQKSISLFQFSIEPNCRKLSNHFRVGYNSENVIVGIYSPEANPALSYGGERLEALYQEANKQNCRLYMFESKDVDIENGEIKGRVSLENEDTEIIGIPDVIYNTFPKLDYAQDRVESWLRTKVPFLTFPIGDKVILPKLLINKSSFGHLFIPFIGVNNVERVFKFLFTHKRAVLKKAAAARGENIFFVEQRSQNRFTVEVDKKPIIMSKDGFANWIEEYIVPERYILQEYKEFRTNKGEPYDIRAHVQKNGEGHWVITNIYPRIGSTKTILSNISLGGRTLDLESFLKDEFSEEKASEYHQLLKDISIEIAVAIDKIYSNSIDELGLDLAIDKSERIWMHEANAKPQTRYHEDKRAINTIAYLKYLAKNRLFLTNEIQQSTGFEDQFKYDINSGIDILDLDKSKVTIGLLYDKSSTKEKFIEACAIMSKYTNVNFFAFRAKDVDYENKVIKGKLFNDFKWEERVVRYPDVVYDRLRMKHSTIYNLVYTELSHVPFTHTLDLKNLNKLKIYDDLADIKLISDYLIPHSKVTDEDQLINFIDKHEEVILKPIHGSFAIGIIKIRKDGIGYIWTEDEDIEYSITQLKRICRDKKVYNNFLVQKFMEFKSQDGRPIDIRIHMVKDKPDQNKWHVAKEYVRVSDGGFKINTAVFGEGRGFSGTTTYVDRYVHQNIFENPEKVVEKIWETSYDIAKSFDEVHRGLVSEQALDLGVTLEGEIFLVEINANRPGVYGYEYEIARYMIPYASSLATIDNVEIE